MSLSNKIVTAIPVVCMLIGLNSCSSKTDAGESEPVRTPVVVAHPTTMNITENITFNATTVFLKKEIVRATFQGFIQKLYKNIGDNVTAGDLLLEIRTKESIADNAVRIPIGSGTFQGSIQIKAKSDGVVTELNYNAGDFVSEGEQIAVLSNPSSLRINLEVPYQYTSRIKIHSDCEIYLPNGRVVSASIQTMIPSVDPAAQTQTYILEMKHSEPLPENLHVNAHIMLRTANNAVVVPQGSVLTNETLDSYWIMKLTDDSTAVRIPVTKGIENDSVVQILTPKLNISDRIVLDGAFGLPDTASVSIGN